MFPQLVKSYIFKYIWQIMPKQRFLPGGVGGENNNESGKGSVDKDETMPTLAYLSNVPSKIIVFCDEVSLSRVYQKNEFYSVTTSQNSVCDITNCDGA